MAYYFVEPMAEPDIEQVQQIEQESGNVRWSAGTYRRELRHQTTSRYIVARASQVPPPPEQTAGFPPGLRRSTPHLLNDLLAGFFKQNAHVPPHPLVGYAGVWIGVDEAHVTTIAVALSCRRQGVGELLLNRLIDYALESGVALLTLEVRLSNSAAQQLYQKYGFQVVGERKRYYTDNGEDALIMSTEAIGSPTYQGRLKALRHALFERLRAQVDTGRLTSGSEHQAVCFP